ncbi:MAG: conjugative transposon protein TraK [Sphingobacterium sp.]|uniref:conjugative transposon protein TraK n=1 Tax=Sphingobacterium sp. JB170 TaxID=1434842 RepID=UPI00097F38D8|nr:conjugative transposon protein TraK [Sphingobacterium sp. JB170]SJN47953.1 Conjugative transposon protein TraK [Sphingobacterium sp. JB170]
MIIKNIEAKVRLATYVSAGAFILALLIVAMTLYFTSRELQKAQRSVYIIGSSGIPVAAKRSSMELNRPAEYRAHIAQFHSYFFTLAPDEKFIESQMDKAMYLIDESGALQYNNLREKGFFNSVLSSSSVLTLQTDSIVLDEKKHYFRFYGKQTIDRRSSTLVRSLVTEGYLRDLELRTENNAHGVLITRWKTLENNDLSHVQKNNF